MAGAPKSDTTALPPPKMVNGAMESNKPRAAAVKSSHPPTSVMVTDAIKILNERGGSSLQAIKKYISANYTLDIEKMTTFIKKYLRNGVTDGKIIQTSGKGATGSFKLSPDTAPKKKLAAAAAKKATSATTSDGATKSKAKAVAEKKKKETATSGEATGATKKAVASTAKTTGKKVVSDKASKAPKESKPKTVATKVKAPKDVATTKVKLSKPKKAASASTAKKSTAPPKKAAPSTKK